jgi:hypothetical protein
MCTVTYIPSRHGCFLTSSRDENTMRPNALTPDVYNCNGASLVYPKDTKASGSWIAFTQSGNAGVLLNGAFAKHISKPPYRKSRGLVFLDIISSPQPEFCFLGTNLQDIEPFTLVLFISSFLFEARWDGEKKYFAQVDEKAPHIWSSATLYSPEIISKRKKWFEQWLTETDSPTATSIFNFHRFAGDGDISSSILMNRNGEMRTVSITGIDISLDAATMQHFDLKEKKHALKSLQLQMMPA